MSTSLTTPSAGPSSTRETRTWLVPGSHSSARASAAVASGLISVAGSVTACAAGVIRQTGDHPVHGDPAERAAVPAPDDQQGADAVGQHRLPRLEQRGVVGQGHDALPHERTHPRAECRGAG